MGHYHISHIYSYILKLVLLVVADVVVVVVVVVMVVVVVVMIIVVVIVEVGRGSVVEYQFFVRCVAGSIPHGEPIRSFLVRTSASQLM